VQFSVRTVSFTVNNWSSHSDHIDLTQLQTLSTFRNNSSVVCDDQSVGNTNAHSATASERCKKKKN
jgi:hypothetical protein